MQTQTVGRAFHRVVEPPGRTGLVTGLREIASFGDLLYFLVKRDVSILYKQTVLGFGWAILRPFTTMIIFSVVFGGLAKIPSDGLPYPIFSYAALVPWTYFAAALTGATESLAASEALLTKVYFPRPLIVLTPILARLVDFCLAFLVLGLMMAWYRVVPSWNLAFLPLLVLLMVATALGMGLCLAAVAIQYRDVKHMVQFLSQLLMYAAPVVWPVSLIPGKFRLAYGLYPMAGVIEGFRAALLGSAPMPWDLLAMGSMTALVLLALGLWYFSRMEAYFADLI